MINQNITFLMGLQMPENITLQEIKENLTRFNELLKTNNNGFLQDASLHEKKTANSKKTLVIMTVMAAAGTNPSDILSKFPQIENYKRYMIAEINQSNAHHSESNNISFEQFCNNEINKTNTIFKPEDTKPACILKAMCNHHYCISGNVIWFNSNPINISKGKFFARQLYCELFLDAIKTVNGFKISSESMVLIDNENAMPHFQDKQLVLPVEEIDNANTIPEIMTTNYKLAMS